MSQKKFRLWLDGQCLQTGSRLRGVGRYVQQLIDEIVQRFPHIDLHISLNAAMAEEAVAARDFLREMIHPENIHVWHGVAEGGEALFGLTDRRRLSEIALAYHVACIKPDVILSASPFEGSYDKAVPLLPNDISGAPMASIFYDAIPLRFSERYLSDASASKYYHRRLQAFRNFDLNLCISDFAKRELQELLGYNNAVDIGAGISSHFLNRLEQEKTRQFEPNTLLYVGGFDWRKNVPAVVTAIGKLDQKLRSEIKFLVVGDINPIAEQTLTSMWSELSLPADNLMLIGHVSDDALVDYYMRVAAVIQPSLMEGFGLTALESVLSGTPVIASNTGALPEIIIDKRYLFDPANTDDIASHIAKVMQPPEGRTLSKEALAHAQTFTWGRTAEIAIDSMSALIASAGNGRSIRTLDQTAIAAANQIKKLGVPKDIVAGCMARSDLRANGKRRLIVDATSTVITDGRSGIQRVVKKICANMHSEDETTVVVAFSDDDMDWYEVEDRRLEIGPEKTKQSGRNIFFSLSDHILMLDSSWTFHNEHAHSLMGARMRGAQVTTCLYDTIPLRASGFSHIGMPPVFSAWFQAALTYSTGFVCISKAVADELLDILRYIRFPRPLNIGYWPLGADFEPMSAPVLQNSNKKTRPNFLMVGTLEPRKGHRVALEAFNLLWKRGIDAHLTIVGKMGWSASHVVEVLEKHPESGKRLVWHKNVTDEELQAHYREADCLIAASFAEGFGLPIVEAGYLDKPIIASDIPVFREVASKSPESRFFQVGDAGSLADTITEFMDTKRTEAVSNEPAWESWKESADSLRNVVLNDGWYMRYEPEILNTFGLPSEIGDVTMRRPLVTSEKRRSMHFFEGPQAADEEKAKKIVVKIRNDSDVLWSSKGTYGVYFAARLYDKKNRCIKEGPKTAIPFVIAPHDTVYLPINIPDSWFKRKGCFIHLEMRQNDADWWGNPIVLPVESLMRQ